MSANKKERQGLIYENYLLDARSAMSPKTKSEACGTDDKERKYERRRDELEKLFHMQ